MPNPREGYNYIRQTINLERFSPLKQRLKPEGIIFSGVAASASFVASAAQEPIALTMHEISKQIDPNLGKLLAIGALGAINAISVATETQSLKKEDYSADYVTNLINAGLGKPLISSLSSHGLGYLRQAFLNPISITAALINKDLFMDNVVSGVFAFSAWSIFVNSLILTGTTHRLIKPVKKISNYIAEKTKKPRGIILNKLNQPLHDLWNFIREE